MELFMEIIALFSCILLIVHIFCPVLIGFFTTKDVSIDYLFSSRDKEIKYSSYFDRSNRAFKNLLETLPIFIILFFLSVFNQVDNFNLAFKTEQKIWKIWSTHPTDKNLTFIMQKGSNLININKPNDAINIFTNLIDLDPYWAEAWNKRATVFYLIGEYQKSQNDINKVLELEKRHFGALAGQGLVNIKLKNYEKAIQSYEKVQQIYPSMQSPKIMIDQIEELIKKQSI